MKKWYRRHHKKMEYAVCKQCCSLFFMREAEKVDSCPACKYPIRKFPDMVELEEDGTQEEALKRIKKG